MRHLSTDERLAAIEAPGAPSHPHLSACEGCRREVVEARAAIAEVRAADVPEPSPLFWERFSARVSERVAREPVALPSRGRAVWRWLAPLATAAAIVVAVLTIGQRWAAEPTRLAAPGSIGEERGATIGDVSPDADDAWTILGRVAGEFDVETLGDSLGPAQPGAADAAVWDLSDGERAELTRLLQAEAPAVGPGELNQP
jgi:hypothetical protein